MRDGKEGYFRRKRGVDKTASLNVRVHDSAEAIGAGEDVQNRAFQKAARQLSSSSQSVNASELPFFRLGGSVSYQASGSGGVAAVGGFRRASALADMPPPLNALADAPAASVAASEVHDDEQDNDDDSEKENEAAANIAPGSNPFQMLHHAIPSYAKEKAAAKAQAKAATKSALGPKPKASGTAPKKRKASDEQPSAQGKILRLDVSRPKSGGGGGAGSGETGAPSEDQHNMSEADKEIISDFNHELTQLKHKVLGCVTDTDAGIVDFFKRSTKDLASFITKMKNKVKSAKRRQDQGSGLKTEVDGMVAECEAAKKIMQVLSNSIGDATSVSQLKSLQKVGFSVSNTIFRRAFKCTTLAALKVADWTAFNQSRLFMQSTMGFQSGETTFEVMISELIQRLLKALPLKAGYTGTHDDLYII